MKITIRNEIVPWLVPGELVYFGEYVPYDTLLLFGMSTSIFQSEIYHENAE